VPSLINWDVSYAYLKDALARLLSGRLAASANSYGGDSLLRLLWVTPLRPDSSPFEKCLPRDGEVSGALADGVLSYRWRGAKRI
jgi:hypothetical protein